MENLTRTSFVFYETFYQAMKEIPEEDQLNAFKAIIEYGLYQTVPELKGMAKVIFMMAKPNIDANYTRWLNGNKHLAKPIEGYDLK